MTSKGLLCGALLVLCLIGQYGRGNAMQYYPNQQMVSQANQYQPSSNQFQQSTQYKPNPYQQQNQSPAQPTATNPQTQPQQQAGYPQPNQQQQQQTYPQPQQPQQPATYPQQSQQSWQQPRQPNTYPQPNQPQQNTYPQPNQPQQGPYPQPNQPQQNTYPQPNQPQQGPYPQPHQPQGPYPQPYQPRQNTYPQSHQQQGHYQQPHQNNQYPQQQHGAHRPQFPQNQHQFHGGQYQNPFQKPYQQNPYQQPYRQPFQPNRNFSNPFGPTIPPKAPTKRIAYIPPCQYLSSRPTPRTANFAPFELETFSGPKTRIERGWPVQVAIKQWEGSPYLFEYFTDFIVYAKPVQGNMEGGPVDPYKPVGVFMTDPMYQRFMSGAKGFKCNRGSRGYDAIGSIDEYTQDVQRSIYGQHVPGLSFRPPQQRKKAEFMWFPSEGAMKATGIQFVAKINIRGEWFKLTSPTWPVYNPPSPEEVRRRQMEQMIQIRRQAAEMERRANAAEAAASAPP